MGLLYAPGLNQPTTGEFDGILVKRVIDALYDLHTAVV